ncbi:MAG: MFS transporter [Phycisphaerae bacterium]
MDGPQITSAVAPSRGRQWELLGNRNFILLWCAYGVSAMGDHLSEMAILKTQDALNAQVDITPLNARMLFMFFVPFFLLAPVAGLLADRLPRRGLMITADVVRCGIMLLFSTLIAWTEGWGSWGPFLPLLLVGMFAAMFSPARSALLPTLIRPSQLVRANGMIAGLGIIATMGAALAGGYIANHYAAVVAFRLDAATFLVSAAVLSFMRLRHLRARSGPSRGRGASVGELVDGFRYAKCHRRVLELLAVAVLVWFCGALVNSVIPAIARDVYGGTYQTISGYRGFLGLGFIIGAIIISTLGDALRSEIAITWCLFGIAVSIATFASSVFLPLQPGTLAAIGAVGVVAAGMFGVGIMASFNSLLQRIVPNRVRGRIFGVRDLCTTAALLTATGFLGLPQGTRVDQWVGYILVVVALVTFVAGFVTLHVRLQRSEQGKGITIAWNFLELFAKFWWRFKRIGPSTIPREGPVIVTANHTCPADPLFLSASLRYRVISFLVAVEYTNWPIARSFMRLIECIPVRREDRDTAATKQAIRHLRAGKAVGIFIQGRIIPPGETGEPKDGAAMLALKTGATVIPVHISGTVYRRGIVRGLLARHRACVRFGPPVSLSEFASEKPNREAVRAASRKILAAIQALAPPAKD